MGNYRQGVELLNPLLTIWGLYGPFPPPAPNLRPVHLAGPGHDGAVLAGQI